MSPWHLLTIGLMLYGAGSFLQIWEEWQERGLTDTSFKSLGLLILGPACIAWATRELHSATLAVAAGLPGLLAAWLYIWKLRDWLRSKRWLK